MKCTKVRRFLPLLVGGDLSPKKAGLVRDHLRRCPSCQKEFRMYELSLKSAKEWFASTRMDWVESEWKSALRKAVNPRDRNLTSLAPWPFGKGWALAAMAVTAVLLAILFLHPSLVKHSPEMAAAKTEQKQPEILSLKLVSKETGLKINWFFHKDLKLEVME